MKKWNRLGILLLFSLVLLSIFICWQYVRISSLYFPLVLQDGRSISWEEIDDFLYQLQDLDLRAVGETAYDLIIIDYSSDGTAGGEYTTEQIKALKFSPGGRKIVLAYMSVGEAEDYRFYWQPSWRPGNPSWLEEENPSWEGNYGVKYWDPAWQEIIFAYTDRLLQAGFDGAYLDLVDAYEYYLDRGRKSAAREMVDFVAAIATHARRVDPDFYIVPQNGAELVELVPGYLELVDGIGQEELYYGYWGDDLPTPAKVTTQLEGYLDRFRGAGKKVFVVDYALKPAHIDEVYARAQQKGYIPFVAVRALDRLIIHPGHEPD